MGVIFRNGIAYGGEGGQGEVDLDLNEFPKGDGESWLQKSCIYGQYERENKAEISSTDVNHFVISTDNAEAKISGFSNIQIGEANSIPYERKVCYNTFPSTLLKMEGASVLKMEKDAAGNANSVPYVHMKGLSYIDISGGVQSSGAGGGAQRTNGKYHTNTHTYMFAEEGDQLRYFRLFQDFTKDSVYPMIMMHGSPTVMMEGAPILQMNGYSALVMDSGTDVVVRPAGAATNPTAIYVEGGMVKMSGSSSYKPIFSISHEATRSGYDETTGNNMQIMLSSSIPSNLNMGSALPFAGNNGYAPPSGRALGWSTNNANFPRTKMGTATTSSYSPAVAYGTNVLFQGGHTAVTIGQAGKLGMRIAALGDSGLFLDWTEKGQVADYKIGGELNSIICADFTRGSSSVCHYKIGCADNAVVTYGIEPHGVCSVKFAPNGDFGVAITPEGGMTDIVGQWKNMDVLIESENFFFQAEGDEHIEMNGAITQVARGEFDSSSSADHHKWSVNSQSTVSGEDYTCLTTTDYRDGDLEKFKKSADYQGFLVSITKGEYDGNGSITSVDAYPRYLVEFSLPGTVEMVIQDVARNQQFSGYYGLSADSKNTSDVNYNRLIVRIKEELQRYYQINTSGVQITSPSSYNGNYGTDWSGYRYFIFSKSYTWPLTFTGATIKIYLHADENFPNGYPAGTTYADLSQENKDEIDRVITKQGIKNLIQSGEVISCQMREDMRYSTTISNYTISKTTNDHGLLWTRPIQNRINVKDDLKGPIHQIYSQANFCMRGPINYDIANKENEGRTYGIPSDTDYSTYGDMYYQVKAFKQNQDYEDFKTAVTPSLPSGYEVDDVFEIHQEWDVDAGKYITTIIYNIKPLGYKKFVEKNTSSPILEMTGPSTLRLHGEINFSLEEINGMPVLNIGTDSGKSIEFTYDELVRLKALLSNS